MPKPTPEPVDPRELPQLAEKVLAADRFPVLATVEADQPRVRPVSPVWREGFVVYVANLKSYAKTAQIAANPRVELCYLDQDHNQVRITGRAEVLHDRGLLEKIWEANRLLEHYLGSMDNPELIIYKIVPSRVLYMKEWALKYWNVTL